MSDKGPSQVQPTDESPCLERIDPGGNVILSVEGQSTARFSCVLQDSKHGVAGVYKVI